MKKIYLMIETDDQATSAEPFLKRKDAEKRMIERFLECVEDIDEEDEKTLNLLTLLDASDSIIGDLIIAEDNYGVNRHGAWWDDNNSYGGDWAVIEIEAPEDPEEYHSISSIITKEDYERIVRFDGKVRFLTETVDGYPYVPEYETPDALYEDWMGECESVPENDALVVLPFETLMNMIQFYKEGKSQ